MRISDWSSDVCSSDLIEAVAASALARSPGVSPGEDRMRSPIILGALVALLTPAGALAQRADLPPSEKVAEALDNHPAVAAARSEEHTSELQSLMRISYAVFCLQKKNNRTNKKHKATQYRDT